jgi:putative transposase
MRRPRARYTDDRGEAALGRYTLMQRPEAMPQAVLRRLLRGVSCRDYEGVVETAREGFGVQRSSVSRHWVRATADQVEQLAQRRFDGVRYVAIFIDGVVYAEETFVVALGLTAAGEKRLLGLRSGGTENAEVCASLLEELRERGVATDQATLLVLDGSKALTAAVRRVWGRKALIQRCQEHKKRNVLAHVPKRHEAEARRRLNEAYRETAYARAVQLLRSTVRWLQTISPDAAASLREGLEETLTVVRLNVPEPLRRTLATTNPIESAFSVSEAVTRRVKRWRDGDMRQRWCVAGLLRAESKFKRVKGHRQIPLLLKALEGLGEGKDLDPSPEAA